jgi:tetratricopeptide (TPR) repeat protein
MDKRLWLCLAMFVAACATSPTPVLPPVPDGSEAVSLLGKPLARPAAAADVEATRVQQLSDAMSKYNADPNDADALIWVGRRLAYLGRYRDSIASFTDGIRKHPRDARFYRHRGHRYITIRQFDRAIADLQKAAQLTRGKPDEVEPDGQPNDRNIPIGSLQSNICYHLGLAYYLKGDFERALPVYKQCAAEASNPDRLVSVSHWLYMTLRRLGRAKEAEAVLEPIGIGMDVIENVSYHKLLLMYRGDISPEELIAEKLAGNDSPTIRYGIGNWYLYNGDVARARPLFEHIVAEDPWPSFGEIAAEAELARP